MASRRPAAISSAPIAVIGAGIVGVATALWLQRAGRDVVLIDRKAPGEEASWGNGGVLAASAIAPVTRPGLIGKAPFMLFDPGKPLFMRWRYLPRLVPWLLRYLSHCNDADTRRIAAATVPIIAASAEDHQALAAGTPAEAHLHTGDYVYIYRSRADFEAEALSWSLRREHGFEWQVLEDEALGKRFPGLDPSQRFGVVLGGHGHVSDPGAYVKALAARFEADGGRVVCEAVTGFDLDGGRIRAVQTGSGEIECSRAVITAGAWSHRLCRMLGVTIPLESERGYQMELWEPSISLDAPIMISAGQFVATPMEGRIRLAGIVEFGGLEAPPSEAPFLLLEREFRKAFPDARWKHATRWMGHRPVLPDSLPVIGALPGVEGVFAGFGHHHVGLTGGPATGRLLAQIVCGNEPNIDMAAYSPQRFVRPR